MLPETVVGARAATTPDTPTRRPLSPGRTRRWAQPSGRCVVIVVGLRLLLPLTIPYYPLIGVVSCLVLDSADQSIFQQFPAIPLDGYQSYDKALDIYYLAIAYMSTMRNWTNRPACLDGQVPLLLSPGR